MKPINKKELITEFQEILIDMFPETQSDEAGRIMDAIRKHAIGMLEVVNLMEQKYAAARLDASPGAELVRRVREIETKQQPELKPMRFEYEGSSGRYKVHAFVEDIMGMIVPLQDGEDVPDEMTIQWGVYAWINGAWSHLRDFGTLDDAMSFAQWCAGVQYWTPPNKEK